MPYFRFILGLGMIFSETFANVGEISWLFQQLSVAAIGVLQHAHLLDDYPVEFDEPFSLRHALSDEYGIEVFHVRQADQFVDGGIIADVACAGVYIVVYLRQLALC